MHPQFTHMTRKRSFYYYRRRLPSPMLGEVSISLHTGHFHEARARCRLLDTVFTHTLRIHPNMTEKDLKPILRDYLRQALTDDQAHFDSVPPGQSAYATNTEGFEHPSEADEELLHHLIGEMKKAIAERDNSIVMSNVEELARDHDILQHQHLELSRGLLQANIQVLTAALDRANGIHPTISHTTSHPISAPTPDEGHPGPLFSEASKEYAKKMETNEVWSGNTTIQNKASFRMFLEVVGDKPVQAYTGEDVAKFYDLLGQLPRDYTNGKGWKGMTLLEIAEAAKGQGHLVKPQETKFVQAIMQEEYLRFTGFTCRADIKLP